MPEKEPFEPKASRPYMPGYGILDAQSGKGLLPWSWAVERLSDGHNYWVETTRPDGRPHACRYGESGLTTGFISARESNSEKPEIL